MVYIVLLVSVSVSADNHTSSSEGTIGNFSHGFSEKFSAYQITKIYRNDSTLSHQRSFDVRLPGGSFVPKALKGGGLNNHFNSLNVEEDEVYVMMQFNTTSGRPTEQQLEMLSDHGVKVFEHHGDYTYYARFPKQVLEKESFEFIRWIGLVEEWNSSAKIANRQELIELESANVTIILYESATDKKQAQLASIVDQVLEDYSKSEGLLIASVSQQEIIEVASLNYVKQIEPFTLPELALDRGAEIIAADYVWPSNDASGITVGIIDSGIQVSHDHFDSVAIYGARDYAGGDNDPEAVCGESDCANGEDDDSDGRVDEGTHGVHVAGIVSGSGTYQGRTIKGVSYDAYLLIQRVFNSNSQWSGPDSASHTIWKNILDPDNDSNYNEASSADIISCSWVNSGTAVDGEYLSGSEEVDLTVLGENGKEALVVFAAGNEYWAGTSYRKVNNPATAKNAITVGAMADFSSDGNKGTHYFNPISDYWESYPEDLYLMEYTERGTDDGRVKPDILAPGSQIVSSVIDNSYISWDGTSMAAPHVAGVAAQLVKQYSPISPAAIKAFIIGQSVGGSTTDNIDIDEGWGALDAYRTVYMLSDEYEDLWYEDTIGLPGSGYSQSVSYSIYVPSGADRLEATLVWSDPAGDASGDGSNTLYNDLDLYMRDENFDLVDGQQDDDDVNNVEKYVIDDPGEGEWNLYVDYIDITEGNYQDYAIKINVIKRTTTPALNVDVTLGESTISTDQNTTVVANVDTDGLSVYNLYADLDVDSGVTILSSEFDGSDSDRDRIGNIPPNSDRDTRTWTIMGDTNGSKSISVYVSGKRVDGTIVYDTDTVTLNVVDSQGKADGQSCSSDGECQSDHCDNDGVGAVDDDWCFSPYNTYYDGQETSYCEYSTGNGIISCDEKSAGTYLDICSGTSYYEEECSNICNYQDVTSVFECGDTGCSCSQPLCDGLSTGSSISTCSGGMAYFADKCNSSAGGVDRDDATCRSSAFASGCTADSECNGVVAGTGNCDAYCKVLPDDSFKFYIRNNESVNISWFGILGNIALRGNCSVQANCVAPAGSYTFINSNNETVAYMDFSGNLCLESGDCSDQSASCNPSGGAVIWQNASGYNMSYIDFTGDLCLMGSLYEDYEI